MDELIKRLREHDDDRLYEEADLLMSEAADALEAKNLCERFASREMSAAECAGAICRMAEGERE